MQRFITVTGIIIMIAAFVLIGLLGTSYVRGNTINDCKDRGGQPVTSPWYAEDGGTVRCIEPSGR